MKPDFSPGRGSASVKVVAGFDLVVWLVGVVLINRTEGNDGAWLAATLGLIGIASFFGFYLATLEMRIAIAASVTLVYLSLISHLLLIGSLRTVVLNDDAGKSVFDSFTGLVTIVVSFYLGSAAAVTGVEVYQRHKTEQERIKAGVAEAPAESGKPSNGAA